MLDVLLGVIRQIRERAEGSGVRVFYGWLSGTKGEGPIVHWNEDHGGNWAEFPKCGKSPGIKLVYLNWAPLEQFQIDEALGDLDSQLLDDELSEEERPELEDRAKDIRNYGHKVGLTAVIDLAFVENGIIHVYQESAEVDY